jgi:hypothetical protein
MATRLQFRKFSTTSIATLVGANGELYVDTTKKTIVVQDGTTPGGSTLATESWVSSALGTVSFNTSVLNGYALSSALTSYTTNANLTSTLANYTTNANLTSTLAAYTFNTSVLTSYTTNANLTSTLAGYALSSALTSYTTNANLTSTLAQYALSSTLTSYTINANLTSTLASFTVSKLQYSSITVQLDSLGTMVLPSGAQLYSGLYSGYPGAGFVTGVATLAATQVYLSNTSGSSYIGIDDTNRVILGYDDTTKYWLFDSSGAIVLPVGGDIKNSSGNSVLGGSTFDSSSLTSYTTNANLTSTLASYTTNANLTSTLTGYVTNANLTSTLSSYVLSSALTSYTTNANLTSTLTGYVTNANLTSTLASYVPTTSLLTVTTLTANTITVTNTSNATTTATGALIVSGGIGVAKDIFLAQAATISIGNSLNLTQNTITTNSANLRIIGGGGQTTRTNIFMTNNAGMALWGGSSTLSPPSAPYGVKIYGGDGPVSLGSGSSESLRLANTGVMINYVHIQGSSSGNAVNIASSGTNTNIDISFTPKGSSGLVQFGTYTASSTLTIVGYVEIKDSSGTIRRLAVVG